MSKKLDLNQKDLFDSLAEGDSKPLTPKQPRFKKARIDSDKAQDYERFNVWIEVSLVDEIKALAFADDKKASNIFREALREYLDKPENQKKIKKYIKK
jgi:hypothetical protein